LFRNHWALFRKWGFPVAPLVIGVVMGPMTEVNFRKTLIMFDGDLLPMLGRPMAAVFLAASVAASCCMIWRARKWRAPRWSD